MQNSLFKMLNIISASCLWVLLSAIAVNFILSRKNNDKLLKQKKSVVETGSMLLFFLIMVLLSAKGIGKLQLNDNFKKIIACTGTLLIIIGTVINLLGRIKLRMNWGNQIRIYKDHTLVSDGVYRYIRHPLYSSTVLMMYGFSFLYINILVMLLISIVFVPFMVHRAHLEDKMLFDTFGNAFLTYRQNTGLFLPKLRFGKKQ